MKDIITGTSMTETKESQSKCKQSLTKIVVIISEPWPAQMEPPEYWADLYTDGNGNCWSDADSGL